MITIEENEPSMEEQWLLHFDDMLIDAMGNVFNTPFNPFGILKSLRMELNIFYMSRFAGYLKMLKGKRVKRIPIQF